MKLCDLALYSPETSSGVRTYIENKISYISAQPVPIEHVVLVPAKEDKVVVQGRSRIYYLRGIPCFYPKVRLVVNIAKAARIIEAEAPDLIELNCQYTLPWAAFLATRKSRLPVIGVPVLTKALSVVDSLYSILQMPKGFPVATMAIGSAGAANAGLMAAGILALNDPALAARLDAWRSALSASIPEEPEQ